MIGSVAGAAGLGLAGAEPLSRSLGLKPRAPLLHLVARRGHGSSLPAVQSPKKSKLVSAREEEEEETKADDDEEEVERRPAAMAGWAPTRYDSCTFG